MQEEFTPEEFLLDDPEAEGEAEEAEEKEDEEEKEETTDEEV